MVAHYTTHIGLAPSTKLTEKLRKYHYQKYVSSPHTTAVYFAKYFSLQTLTSILENNIPSYAPPYTIMKADFSWRIRLVATHISHVPYIFTMQFSMFHVSFWDKIILRLISPKSIQITPPAICVALYALEE